MKNKNPYYVFELDNSGKAPVSDVWGPFPSLKAVERWIKSDAEHLFGGSLEGHEPLGVPDESWSPAMVIVQSVKVVRPCPMLNVKVVLKPVEEEL